MSNYSFKNKDFLESINIFNKYWNLFFTGILRKYNMGASRFIIIGNLGHSGKLTLTEISRILVSKKSTVTEVVDNMEKEKLVIRARDDKDRRKIFLQLTDDGKKLFNKLHEKMVPEIISSMENLFSCFEKEEINNFYKIIKKMNKILADKVL